MKTDKEKILIIQALCSSLRKRERYAWECIKNAEVLDYFGEQKLDRKEEIERAVQELKKARIEIYAALEEMRDDG